MEQETRQNYSDVIMSDKQYAQTYAAMGATSMLDDGFTEAQVRKAARLNSFARVDRVHAKFMRDLTGGASIEERDTWKTKEDAARSLIAGNATDGQTAMIALEASGDGTKPEDLAAIIVAKADGFQTLIGMASKLKVQAKAAIAQATADNVPIDQVQSQIDAVFANVSDQTTAAIAQWQAGA